MASFDPSGNRHLLIITGASAGFGRALAASFCERVKQSLHVVLVARSLEGMEATRSIMLSKRRADRPLTVECVVANLSDPLLLRTLPDDIFRNCQNASFSDVTFLNNAGSLLPIKPIGCDSDSSILSETIQLNLTAPCVLISEFVRRCRGTAHRPRVTIANVSSLWALQPCETFSAYCATKAGMEMFLQVLAKETRNVGPSEPTFMVLNYAPGPLDTAMQEQIRSATHADSSVQEMCRNMWAEKRLINPDVSALKCARLVVEHKYTSGAHIDFFDKIEGIDFPSSVPTTCCACTYCECGPSCQCKPKRAPDCDPCVEFAARKC
jgi:sepiapterin reductase